MESKKSEFRKILKLDADKWKKLSSEERDFWKEKCYGRLTPYVAFQRRQKQMRKIKKELEYRRILNAALTIQRYIIPHLYRPGGPFFQQALINYEKLNNQSTLLQSTNVFSANKEI